MSSQEQKKKLFVFYAIFFNVLFSIGLALYVGRSLGPWRATPRPVVSDPSLRFDNLTREADAIPTTIAVQQAGGVTSMAEETAEPTPAFAPLVSTPAGQEEITPTPPSLTGSPEPELSISATAQATASALTSNDGEAADPLPADSDGEASTEVPNLAENDDLSASPGTDVRVGFIASSEQFFDLYVGEINSQGAIQGELLFSNGQDLFYPDFEPGGARVTYHAQATATNWEIYLIQSDDQSAEIVPINLSADPAQDSFARWAPDLPLIAFQSDRVNGQFDLFTVSPDGGEPQAVTTSSQDDLGPAWSPDGTQIAFHRRLSPAVQEIFTIDLETGIERQLTRRVAISQFADWSPDGSTIVFQSQVNGVWQLFRVDAESAEIEQLPSDPRNSFFPQWSPDGESILYHVQVDAGNRDLYQTFLASGETVQLTNSAGQERMIVPLPPDAEG